MTSVKWLALSKALLDQIKQQQCNDWLRIASSFEILQMAERNDNPEREATKMQKH